MLHRLKSRRAWLVATVVVATVIVATAAASSRTDTEATGTLVVDKSFDLKTPDPQRQYEVSGGIVDHVLYDTLLKFRGADVATPAAVRRHRLQGLERGQDLHVHAAEGRALLRRDAADGGGRRLLVPPPDQPEGQPVLPARRHYHVTPRASTRSS